jgi:signal peptidase I
MDAAKTSRGLPGWFKTMAVGRRPMLTLARLAVLVIGTWLVFSYVLTRPIRVEGISMEPTFHEGQINFLNRLAYLRHDPRRGDVVGIRFKGTDGIDLMYLKRIVGLPGETVAFENGKLMIDDAPVDEPYVKTACNWDMPPLKLGPGDFFVTGDNRSMDISLHWHKKVRRDQIVGRILFGARSGS